MLEDLDRLVKEGKISAGVALAVVYEQMAEDLTKELHCKRCNGTFGCSNEIPDHAWGLCAACADLAAAIAAERERCAKIAEAHSGCPVGGCDGKDCGMDIAAKIRSGE